MPYHLSKQIKAPVEIVFEYISNPLKINKNTGHITHMEFHEPLDTGSPVGRTFTQDVSGYVVYSGQVIAFERPRIFGLKLFNTMGVIEIMFALSESSDGTLVEVEIEWPGIGNGPKTIEYAFEGFVEMMVNKQLAAVKKKLRRRSTSDEALATAEGVV